MGRRQRNMRRVNRFYEIIAPRALSIQQELAMDPVASTALKRNEMWELIRYTKGRYRSTPIGHVWAYLANGTKQRWDELTSGQRTRYRSLIISAYGASSREQLLAWLRRLKETSVDRNTRREFRNVSPKSEQYKTLANRLQRQKNFRSIVSGVIATLP